MSCARSYNVSMYAEYACVNSQVAEQCISALNRNKGSVSQMKQTTFMCTIRLFLEMWNRRKMQKLDVIKQHLYGLEFE